MRIVRSARLVLLVAAIVGCRDGTRPELLLPELAAGNYMLASVSGRGPVSGTFVLTMVGGAERRVRYATPSGTYEIAGTFQLRGDSIEFALVEDAGGTPYVWHVRGARFALGFNIRYPDPADGPDIVETYRRE